MEETDVNSLVIDVKGDRGNLTYRSSIPLVSEVGGQKLIIVKDIKGMIKSLKEKGVYTIARIVVFKTTLSPSQNLIGQQKLQEERHGMTGSTSHGWTLSGKRCGTTISVLQWRPRKTDSTRYSSIMSGFPMHQGLFFPCPIQRKTG